MGSNTSKVLAIRENSSSVGSFFCRREIPSNFPRVSFCCSKKYGMFLNQESSHLLAFLSANRGLVVFVVLLSSSPFSQL